MIKTCKKNIKDKKTTIIGIVLIIVSIIYAFVETNFNTIVFTSFILLGVGLVVAPDKIIEKIKL